ncbi:MAG: ATP-binding protein, partial [Clostridia bacterium]
MFNTILILLQLFLTTVMGIYFFNMLRGQHTSKSSLESDSARELEKLRRLKQIHLTQPLSEKTRPADLSEVIGQEEGIRALKAALCGPNPQHILIYGPPGVGKTAAARAVLREAIASESSPFREGAKFVEMDATTLRFDERGIADPLIGSVHDPIYQGAGAYGPAGVPQPKPGAVTKAHGGILFLDEIGELHPTQINKLLKVLEDRKVFLESAYYSSGNRDIPPHVHEIFQKGLPADFRLIGATTRGPEDIPPAIRSRCVEIFFTPLSTAQLRQIAENAAKKGSFTIGGDALSLVCKHAQNGRDAVNIIQIAGSVAMREKRFRIEPAD